MTCQLSRQLILQQGQCKVLASPRQDQPGSGDEPESRQSPKEGSSPGFSSLCVSSVISSSPAVRPEASPHGCNGGSLWSVDQVIGSCQRRTACGPGAGAEGPCREQESRHSPASGPLSIGASRRSFKVPRGTASVHTLFHTRVRDSRSGSENLRCLVFLLNFA